ncbi:MAG: MMPL family transporter, partial [Candidatus Altiarchaeota archaeon]|nr:MMPL family transporter [Candidatus Altiarchaeota archaeon]
NVTSGGASMIMGIGIDFGIQVTSRFRIEARNRRNLPAAMAETIRAVTMPMGTTTLAALIGFRAMSMGELKVLSDLADMMSLGVLCCMLAAITLVPALLVLGDKYLGWFSWSKIFKIKKGWKK